MTTITRPPLVRDMLPPTPPPTDRLPPMLFLAALFHALIILGVTFDPQLEFQNTEATTLDVIILANPDQFIDSNDDADYLSQANQEGGGNTREQTTPGAAPDGLATEFELGELLGDVVPETRREPDTDASFVTGSDATRQVASADESLAEAAPEELAATALPTGLPSDEPLPTDLESRPDVYDDDPRELVFSVDTRESELAGYLAQWKRKVETIGTDYYNREVAGIEHDGSPVIEVAIDANGDLKEIILKRSSGSGRIDQAALSVLRRAAPYDPIPNRCGPTTTRCASSISSNSGSFGELRRNNGAHRPVPDRDAGHGRSELRGDRNPSFASTTRTGHSG